MWGSNAATAIHKHVQGVKYPCQNVQLSDALLALTRHWSAPFIAPKQQVINNFIFQVIISLSTVWSLLQILRTETSYNFTNRNKLQFLPLFTSKPAYLFLMPLMSYNGAITKQILIFEIFGKKRCRKHDSSVINMWRWELWWLCLIFRWRRHSVLLSLDPLDSTPVEFAFVFVFLCNSDICYLVKLSSLKWNVFVWPSWSFWMMAKQKPYTEV